MNDWIKEIEINDLDEKNKEFAEIVGVENFLKLCKHYGGGTAFYFNVLEEILKPIRNKKIVEEFDGYNIKYLAKRYRLTDERIKQIVKDEEIQKTAKKNTDMIKKNQISLWDKWDK